MTVALHPQFEGKVLHVRASDKLNKEHYEQLVPEFEKLIEQHGKIRILVELDDFHGWTGPALWEDLKVTFQHFNDVERIAIVGDKAWQEGMSFFCKPFTSAEVRYFGHHEHDRATQWVREGVAEPTGKLEGQ